MEHILIVKALLNGRTRNLFTNEVKNNKYHSVGKVLKSNIKIAERGKIDTLTQKYMTLTFLVCYMHLNKNGGVKPVLWAQTSHLTAMMRSCKCFPHVSIMPTLTYNWANSAIVQKDLILNIMHSTFNLSETEAVIWILSVILKRADGNNHYLNIRQYTMPSYDIIVSQWSTLNN